MATRDEWVTRQEWESLYHSAMRNPTGRGFPSELVLRLLRQIAELQRWPDRPLGTSAVSSEPKARPWFRA